MKRFIAVLIILSFALPVQAQLPGGFEPVEKDLIKKQQEQEMTRDVLKQQEKQHAKTEASQGSSWWKWTLGILLVGGIAAAAGGGGGGGGGGTGTSDTGPGTTGSTTVGW